jgi:hypothetical protein
MKTRTIQGYIDRRAFTWVVPLERASESSNILEILRENHTTVVKLLSSRTFGIGALYFDDLRSVAPVVMMICCGYKNYNDHTLATTICASYLDPSSSCCPQPDTTGIQNENIQ